MPTTPFGAGRADDRAVGLGADRRDREVRRPPRRRSRSSSRTGCDRGRTACWSWPPIPLQPLDDGPDRKLAHSDRLALPMMSAPAACRRADDERVAWRAPCECPRAGRRRHAGGVDVVLDDDRDPEQRTLVTLAPRPVGRTCVGECRRADRDDGVERRVQLADPPEIEGRQLDRAQPMLVHQLLELRDRCRVDVDARDLGAGRVASEPEVRRRAGYPEREGEQGRQNNGTPKSAPHRVLLGRAELACRSNAVRSRLVSPATGTPSFSRISPLPVRVLGLAGHASGAASRLEPTRGNGESPVCEPGRPRL